MNACVSVLLWERMCLLVLLVDALFFSYSPPTIWRVIQVTRYSRLHLVALPSTYAMDVIILLTGWRMASMELR